MVSWSATGGDGTGANVYAQSFSAAGDPSGEKFQINSTTAGDQKASDIEFAENGDLIATWISSGQDGDGNGVFAQRLTTGTANSYYSPDGTVYTGETHTMDGITMSGASHTADSFILTTSPPASNEDSSSSSISSSGSSSSSGPTLDSPSNAMAAITAIDKAIKTVNIQRSKLGAVSNRLSHTVNNLTNISSNLSAAQGSIEDADFAKETTDLAKNRILQQASTAMMAQANASKQNVLSLLQG